MHHPLCEGVKMRYGEPMENREPPAFNPEETGNNKAEQEIRVTPLEYAIEWKAETDMERMGARLAALLAQAGGEAYFAGGYPRELVMHREKSAYPDFTFNPHDIDIATNLLPDDVVRILDAHGIKTKTVGKQFQVVNAVLPLRENGSAEFEIATFRVEGDYGKDRRPRFVEPTRDKRQDIQRRDFTMNALLFDPAEKKLIDYANGVRHIQERTLAFVGDPNERITEDPLRILRYVRFRNKYRMRFDRTAKEAIYDQAPRIKNLSAERVKEEMDKILTLPRAAFAVGDLARIGALKEFLPEVYELFGVEHTPKDRRAVMHREGDVFKHELRVLRAIERPEFIAEIKEKLNLDANISDEDAIARFYEKFGAAWAWANLFHDTGKKQTQDKLAAEGVKSERFSFFGHEAVSQKLFAHVAAKNRINFSNNEREAVDFLIAQHMNAHHIGTDEAGELSMRSKRRIFRNQNAEALLFLSLADSLGNYSNRQVPDKIAQFDRAWKELKMFRTEDAKRQEVLALGGRISSAAIEAFTSGGSVKQAKGFPLIGPVKTAVLVLLAEKRISETVLEKTVAEAVKVLLTNGLTADARGDGGVAETKRKAQTLLEEHFKISFEDACG